MKYCKKLGLLAVAAATLMVFVGTASATITSPAGVKYTGLFKATSTNVQTHGSVKVACHSLLEGYITDGGTTFPLSLVTITGCGQDTKNIVAKGTISISSSGTVTSTGMESTVQLHRTVFGIPITTHCIYKTNGTDMGTLTEGVSPAVLHVGSAPVPEVATDGACGNDAVWTGTYTILTPASGIIVH